MALKPTPEQLARLMDDPGGMKFIRAGYSGYRNQAVFTFDWQGSRLQFLAAIVEVLEGEVPENARSRSTDERNPGRLAAIMGKKKVWTEDELRREGLPLYFSDEWLLRVWKELESQMLIEKVYGYSNQAISRRLIRLGIETRPRNTDEQRARVRQLLAEGKLGRSAIAREVGVSKATVTRIAQAMEEAARR